MLQDEVNSHIEIINSVSLIANEIEESIKNIYGSLRQGGRIFICGNGGSAADAQHFAAEMVGRFKKERQALSVTALTTDTSIMTAVANDYDYEDIFARQIQAFGSPADVLIGISTSGNAVNVENGVNSASDIGMYTIGLLGKGGGRLAEQVNIPVIVPSDDTARIQETHIFLLHYIADNIEQFIVGG